MADVLPLTNIRTDGNTQAREMLDQAVIDEYAEAFERGDMFPPIDVYFDGETHWLADGFHRIKAAAKIGQDTMPAWCLIPRQIPPRQQRQAGCVLGPPIPAG